jgi:hypothetical protein
MKVDKPLINKEYNQYYLMNLDNYKTNIENTIQDILYKYVNIMIEFLTHITERITIKNFNYYKYIITRGIDTITHVFKIMFYYTKNLDLTIYHSQKAYYFYIEFIEQISDDNITFLKLNSRDATLFVYKKTIFEISNEVKKKYNNLSDEDENQVKIFDIYIIIYKFILHFLINNKEFNNENKIEYINIYSNKILELTTQINKYKIKKNTTECIYNFCSLLVSLNISSDDFFKLLTDFLKKMFLKKKNINERSIMNKIIQIEIDKYIESNDYLNLIDEIFSNN